VIQLGRCFCPKCDKKYYGTGRIGTQLQCSCGAWISQSALDRVRYYWIFQIAISFGLAAFFFALAVFFRDLPTDPWERFLNPMLQGPSAIVFIISYLILIWHKKKYAGHDLLFRYYLWGVSLLSICVIFALLISMSKI